MSDDDQRFETQLNNWPKFVLLLVSLLGLLAGWLSGVAPWEDVEPIVVAIVFYSAGNGIAAVKKQPQQPIFAPKRRTEDHRQPD